MKNKNAGFSLVELAISITVVGLILALVAKGGEMIENAKIASTVLQIESYQAGIDGFRTAYKAWPGDYDRAEMYIENCNSANNCEDGNGDGAIAFTGSPSILASAAVEAESLNVWRHLFLSGFGTGLPSGSDLEYGSALPSASAGGGFEIYSDTNLYMNSVSNMAQGPMMRYAGKISTTELVAEDGIYGVIARSIDMKMDDGVPQTGAVMSGSLGTRCVDTDGFIEADLDETVCFLFVHLGR